MPLIANPPSYITAAQLRAMPLDYDLSSYTDPQLQDICNRVGGMIDAELRRSLLAQERNLCIYGTGQNTLELGVRPVIWVRELRLIQPGTSGYVIPISQTMIDYERGEVTLYSPLELQGIGTVSIFPRNVPILAVVASGYGVAVSAPTWAHADAPGSLAPGMYDFAVTTRTEWGETTATTTVVTTALGGVMITVTPTLGASQYRVFAAPHGATPLTLVAEISATTYNTTPITALVTNLNAPTGEFSENLPTVDTSAHAMPFAFTEAARLYALSMIFEQNNLANRGVQLTVSDGKRTGWRSTEGSSGKGAPLYAVQAASLLAPYALAAIF